MTLGQFTEAKLLIPLLLSDRQADAIQELTQRLEATHRIENASAFLETVLKREMDMPTFIDGVAVPHVRGGAVSKLSVAVGTCAAGIRWGRDGRHVAQIVFLFAVPLTESNMYLSLLSGVSSLIQDEMAFSALKRATQPEEMHSVLNAMHLIQITARPRVARFTTR
jgi:mannitol/fructose-specific phosphotransferase system IIA component (Ntr-type)